MISSEGDAVPHFTTFVVVGSREAPHSSGRAPPRDDAMTTETLEEILEQGEWGDDAQEDEDDDLAGASTGKKNNGKGKGKGRGAAKAKAKQRQRKTVEPCIVNCTEKRYNGFRFCQMHKRAWEAMKLQSEYAEEVGE